MTQFQRINKFRHSQNIANSIRHNTSNNALYTYQQQKRELALQAEYSKLDKLAYELEKELQEVKTLKIELENYKVKFGIDVKDEATKKIQELIAEIDKIIK